MSYREEWLHRAIAEMRPWFDAKGFPLPDQLQVAVGFPSRLALSIKKRRIGEHWVPSASKDGVGQIFISPVVEDASRALGVLVHELVHAAVGHECGHKGDFRRVAVAFGLTGKMTATEPGPELIERLNDLSAALGEFPHSAIDPAARNAKKQSTRMLKAQCENGCPCIVRVAAKWADDLPMCGCGSQFQLTDGGGHRGDR